MGLDDLRRLPKEKGKGRGRGRGKREEGRGKREKGKGRIQKLVHERGSPEVTRAIII
jgi:hypothetical protein